MDKNNIVLVREDLEEDFRALTDGHTKAITALLEEFKDDQMVLRLEAEKALVSHPRPRLRSHENKMSVPPYKHHNPRP